MLVEHLPESSAFHASLRGGREFRPWTTETYLATATVNLLYAANRQRANQKTRIPLVEPPKAKPKRRTVTVAQIVARQQRRGARPPK